MTTLPAGDPAVGADAERELDERRLQVIHEQASGLRWQIVLTAAVVCAVAWRDVPTAALLPWLLAVVATREWRAHALGRMVRDRSTPIEARLRATVGWNLLIGVCNGSAALFMHWLAPELDAVLTMILVSWGAGAVSTSSTVMRAFLAYAAMLFLPTAAMWLLNFSGLGLGVGLLVLMFFGVQIRFARSNLETFEASFRIRLENLALAASLERERSDLALARDAAVRANLDKSRFLAGASHDLRQPLQAMALNVGALERHPLAPEPAQIVGEVATSLADLRALLDALLDLSKLDAGAVVAQPRRLQLDRLLQGVAAGCRTAAAGRGLALRVVCPPQAAVHADPDLLRRVLSNLLDNAVKFTPAGEVELRAEIDGDEVELSVRDTGPGIAPEHQALVFEDLVRLDQAAAAGTSGHGLGLGIVRRLAELMHTRVDLQSQPGAGATFSLRLPRADAETFDAEPAASRQALAGQRVLIVDDDAMLRGAYVHAITALGGQALTAADADAALRALAADSVDIAIVDHQLGAGASGFEAVARLRALRPGLPVLMVTADTAPAPAVRACELGLPLLHKPLDAEQLSRALQAALERPTHAEIRKEVPT